MEPSVLASYTGLGTVRDRRSTFFNSLLAEEWGLTEFTADQLVELISNTIATRSWENEGWNIQAHQGVLIVRTTKAVHEQVGRLLELMRSEMIFHNIEVRLISLPAKDVAFTLPLGPISGDKFEMISSQLLSSSANRQIVSFSVMNTQRGHSESRPMPATPKGEAKTAGIIADVRPILESGAGMVRMEMRLTAFEPDGDPMCVRSTARFRVDGAFLVAVGSAPESDSEVLCFLVRTNIDPSELSEFHTKGVVTSVGSRAEEEAARFYVADLIYVIPNFPGPQVHPFPPDSGQGKAEAEAPDSWEGTSLSGAIFMITDDVEGAISMDFLTELIPQSTGGDSWDENENANIEIVNNTLIITQRPEVIKEVEVLLSGLRKWNSPGSITLRCTYFVADQETTDGILKTSANSSFPATCRRDTIKAALPELQKARIAEILSITCENTQRAYTMRNRRLASVPHEVSGGTSVDVTPIVGGNRKNLTLELRQSYVGAISGSESQEFLRNCIAGTYRMPVDGGMIFLLGTKKGEDGKRLNLLLVLTTTFHRAN